MQKNIAILFLSLSLFSKLCFGSDISFDPSEFGIGARPLGMGYAFSALGDDANALFSNPAGTASISDLNATSMYANVLNSVNYFVLGGAKPTGQGTLGLGYINVSSPPTDIWEFIGGIPVYMGSSSQMSQLFLFSFSKELCDNLFLGTSLKWFKFDITGGGPSYEAYGSGTDLDLGIKFLPRDWLSLAATGKNVLPTNLGGRFLWSDNKAEAIPHQVILGAAVRALGKKGMREFRDAELNLALEGQGTINGLTIMRLGLEYWPNVKLALRAGMDADRWSIGAGIKNKGITFDYAYKAVLGPASNNSHSISIGYVGETEERFETLSHEKPLGPNVVKLTKFSDVPDKYYARDAIEKLAGMGIISGFPSGNFKPEDTVSRAEFALVLVRAKNLELPKVSDRFIKDLPPDYWPAPYVKAAIDQGWIAEFPDKTFRPNWPMKLKDAINSMTKFDSSFNLVKTNLPFVINDQVDLTRGELSYMLYKTDFISQKKKEVTFK